MTMENQENGKTIDYYVEKSRLLFEDQLNSRINRKDYIEKSKEILNELKNDKSITDEEKEDEIDALQRLIETEELELKNFDEMKNFTDLPDKEDLSKNQN